MPCWIEKTRKIIELINLECESARYVGGCVRDSIIERPVKDIDIATTMLPEKLMQVLNKYNIKAIPTGLKHGTITALINDTPVEITTLRKDIVCDGRHAQVDFTRDWFDDAKRRDFTFNALYMDNNKRITDFFNGKKDLENRELNFVGDPEERIQEDYLRILRVFRFHTAICKTPLSEIILLTCKKYAHKMQLLSAERIQSEMFKILSYPNCMNTLILMQNYQILKEILPTEDIVLEKINSNLVSKIENPIVKLAAIIRTANNATNITDMLLTHWKISKKHYKELKELINFEAAVFNPKHLIVQYGKNFFDYASDLYMIEGKISIKEHSINKQLICNWEIPEFPISGRDILELGIAEGKEIGKILHSLKHYWQSHNFCPSKGELLALALQELHS